MSNGIKIKERVDLFQEVKWVYNTNKQAFPQIYKNLSHYLINKSLNGELKRLLFKVYIALRDKDAHNRVNNRFKRYLAKINSGILEEGYTTREKTLELIDWVQDSYKNK